MIRVIFVRHGDKQIQDPEKSAPLSEEGVERVRRLAAGLRSLGLRPDAFLASESRHALQTAEILRDTLRPGGQYAIVAATALTPGTAETEFKWTRMLEEAGRSVSVLEARTILCVGHEPRLGQLIQQLTQIPMAELSRAQAVYVEADDFDQLRRAEGWLRFRIPHDDRERSLESKLQSKMQVSTLLAGFTFAALVNVLTEPSFWPTPLPRASASAGEVISRELLPVMAVIVLTLALALFVAAVYMYDRLALPRQFWTGERRRSNRRRFSFERDDAAHGAVYAHMVWIWKYVFGVAVLFASLGFLFVVAYRMTVYTVVAVLVGIVAAGAYYWWGRPKMVSVD